MTVLGWNGLHSVLLSKCTLDLGSGRHFASRHLFFCFGEENVITSSPAFILCLKGVFLFAQGPRLIIGLTGSNVCGFKKADRSAFRCKVQDGVVRFPRPLWLPRGADVNSSCLIKRIIDVSKRTLRLLERQYACRHVYRRGSEQSVQFLNRNVYVVTMSRTHPSLCSHVTGVVADPSRVQALNSLTLLWYAGVCLRQSTCKRMDTAHAIEPARC